MTRPRVVIAGAGLMGRWHRDAARHAGGEVVAIVDPDLERSRHLAGPRTRACATLADALSESADVVHICTPLAAHLDVIRTALEARCHVIAEKPVTATASEASMLAREAAAAGRLVVPVHQFVFQRGVRAILTRRHLIGPLRHIEFSTCSAGAEGAPADARDAIAAEIVPHAFALARAALQRTVGDIVWSLQRAAPGEWRFTASTPEGCTVSGLVSLAARPTFASWRILGEGGSSTADLFHGHALHERGSASRAYKMFRPVSVGVRGTASSVFNLARRAAERESAYPGLRALCAATYAAIRGDGPDPFRADEIADVAAAREQLIRLASVT